MLLSEEGLLETISGLKLPTYFNEAHFRGLNPGLFFFSVGGVGAKLFDENDLELKVVNCTQSE